VSCCLDGLILSKLKLGEEEMWGRFERRWENESFDGIERVVTVRGPSGQGLIAWESKLLSWIWERVCSDWEKEDEETMGR
jgi:hypothetical protein